MQQVTKTTFNQATFRFEQTYTASDGCEVIIDVERMEDDWARDNQGKSYQEYKAEQLNKMEAHPHGGTK